MMTLVIFSIGNNSNIDDEGGGEGSKGHFFVDVIRYVSDPLYVYRPTPKIITGGFGLFC